MSASEKPPVDEQKADEATEQTKKGWPNIPANEVSGEEREALMKSATPMGEAFRSAIGQYEASEQAGDDPHSEIDQAAQDAAGQGRPEGGGTGEPEDPGRLTPKQADASSPPANDPTAVRVEEARATEATQAPAPTSSKRRP